MTEHRAESNALPESVRWSVWFYKPGSWLGRPIYFGNAEGCTRTLLIGTKWTGCVVFGLWRMRYDPECPDCVVRCATSPGRRES